LFKKNSLQYCILSSTTRSSQTLPLKYELDAAEVGLLLMGFSIAYTVMAPIFGVIMDCGLTPIVAVLMGNLTISLSMFLLGEVYTFTKKKFKKS